MENLLKSTTYQNLTHEIIHLKNIIIIKEIILVKKKKLPQTKLEALATHSSTLAWRVPWMGEPGGLQSMGSHRVGHD